ncbi:hypothetical protein RD792_014088 [Penstemon davidsonii]|uniref:Potassium transporter n=1 Tax=Penstemon davidsonii TaxID=160366 RepID=A0ABR0CPC7_9LAMI|nr:hypothetical protein RD792_014088 [Penstemon davidsonii]
MEIYSDIQEIHEEIQKEFTAAAIDQTIIDEEVRLPNNKPRKFDLSDVEYGRSSYHHGGQSKSGDWLMVMQLAFQSLGVVYGDLGTSPLYVYQSIFPEGIKHNDDIIGALSLILYTLTLIPLIKYVFIVLHANDNGNGGTFALYSLLCRYANVGMIPSEQIEDWEGSRPRASKLKNKLENNKVAKLLLLFATMLGTAMVLGDGILSPCISVLSAVGGIKSATPKMTEDMIVWISVSILIVLFMVQRFGTDRMGYTFAPILMIWFILIGGIGIFNLIKHDTSVLKALNPMYILDFFKRNKFKAWTSLGGVILCTTGAEALFADLGHFSVRSIKLSACTIVYPSVFLAYVGQAAYLRHHNFAVSDSFYKSVPTSQSLISGSFSVIQQSLSLGCFPRVSVIHTSTKHEGQVYIPEINYLLMTCCIVVTLVFRDTVTIGNAYGIAVVSVMALTSSLLVLVMTIIWKTSTVFVVAYILIFGTVELAYLSAVMYKFKQGGYLPLAFSLVLVAVMFSWNYVHRRTYHYEAEHKISMEEVREIVSSTSSQRLPGVALFYSELVHAVPPIFKHYVANIPALHSILVFMSVKSIPVSKVPMEEQFHFRRVQPTDLPVFTCVMHFGYDDVLREEEVFEDVLVVKLRKFLWEYYGLGVVLTNGNKVDEVDRSEAERDIQILNQSWSDGVVHFMAEHEVVAEEGASIFKRIFIQTYNVLKNTFTKSRLFFDLPQEKVLRVGMVYKL